MKDFQGKVNDIDVIATPGQPLRCLAFITKAPQNEIQVTTGLHPLQTALELAAAKNVLVEVSYEENGPENNLTRVHLLDRQKEEELKAALARAGAPSNVSGTGPFANGGYLLWATDASGNAIALAWEPK
jgi:hypothetical protein